MKQTIFPYMVLSLCLACGIALGQPPGPPVSRNASITFDGAAVKPHFPEDIGGITPDQAENPTLLEAQRQSADTFTIELINEEKLARDQLLDEQGNFKDYQAVGSFIEDLAKLRTKEYSFTPHDRLELPEALRKGTLADRYVWLSGECKSCAKTEPSPGNMQNNPAGPTEFLWRILLVEGDSGKHIIVAQRKISPAYVQRKAQEPNNDVDPTKMEAWQFLTDLDVSKVTK